MAKIWFYSNTEVEYIFDYGQDIAALNGESAVITKDPADDKKLILKCRKADGTNLTMNIEPPKKPVDMGGSGLDITSLFTSLSADKQSALKEMFVKYINDKAGH